MVLATLHINFYTNQEMTCDHVYAIENSCPIFNFQMGSLVVKSFWGDAYSFIATPAKTYGASINIISSLSTNFTKRPFCEKPFKMRTFKPCNTTNLVWLKSFFLPYRYSSCFEK